MTFLKISKTQQWPQKQTKTKNLKNFRKSCKEVSNQKFQKIKYSQNLNEYQEWPLQNFKNTKIQENRQNPKKSQKTKVM